MTTPARRPGAATAFGVLNIIFGAFGVLGLRNISASFAVGTLFGVGGVVGGLMSILLLIVGIFLMTNRAGALRLTKLWCFLSLGINAVYAVLLGVLHGMLGLVGGIVALIIGLVYPLLLLGILVNDDKAKTFYAAREEVNPYQRRPPEV